MSKRKFYVAEYHSSHFDFMAVAEDPVTARDDLIRGLKRHGRNRNVYPGPHTWFEPEDINITEVPEGGATIDGSVL